MSEALFDSVHAALSFAFRRRLQTVERAPMNRASAPAHGTGRGLGGFDGAAQAGMICQEVEAFGEINKALLTARHAPRHSPCECGAPCCSGHRPNRAWVDAIAHLAEHMRTEALKGCSTTSLQRIAYVARYFTPKSERESIEELAARFEQSTNTVSAHFGRVSTVLGGTEARKRKLAAPGIETLARQLAEDRFQALGWIGDTAA